MAAQQAARNTLKFHSPVDSPFLPAEALETKVLHATRFTIQATAGGRNLEADKRFSDDGSTNGTDLESSANNWDLSSQSQCPPAALQLLSPISTVRKLRCSRDSSKMRPMCAVSGFESCLPLSCAPGSPQPRSSGSKSCQIVRFEAQPITSIWPALSSKEYDRRSIVVDLSKTPFALFRKDAVLMKGAAAATAPSTPLPKPSPAALDVGYQTAIPGVPSKSTSCPSSESSRSEDSDTSDSSTGHTDTETDLDPSDSESSPYSKRMPGPRMGVSDAAPAFFGVWKRTSSEGYERFLRSSGVPKKATAMALRKHPVHIIDHDGAYFRLIVKNGLSKVDNTYFIGDEPKVDKIGKQSYDVSLNWGDVSGHGSKDDLTLSSICQARGEEFIAIRSLVEDGDRMVLTQIVRRPAEQYEVRAKHFFKRITHKSELQTRGRVPSSNLVTVRVRSNPQGSSSA